MNKIYSTLLFVGLLFFSVAAQAQVSRGFSFQGYARSFDGAALTNQSVTVQFSIYPFGASPEYVENQTVTTDAYGVFQLFVGAGGSGTRSVTTGVFNNIIFGSKNYWLKVEVRSGGGSYATISDTQLAAVPYSKSAERADNSKSAERADNGVPPGTILAFASNNVPAGYFLCDGGPLNKDEFPELFNAIGYTWGGSGSTFNKPDTRGLFLRGWDRGASRDGDRNTRYSQRSGSASGDNVGSEQGDGFRVHNHFGSTGNAGGHSHTYQNASVQAGVAGDHTAGVGGSANISQSGRTRLFTLSENTGGVGDHNHSIPSDGISETRVKNVYVNYIVKF